MEEEDEPLDCVCCAMRERRISGWFVLSAVFIVAVFGLFFTFTERKTWPVKSIELSTSDMRLVPAVSTLWCEAISLQSDHPFVAHQVNVSPFVNPLHLTKQELSLNLKLNGGQSVNSNSLRLRYFLLPGSVIDVVACATRTGGRVLVFKGEEDVGGYLQYLWKNKSDSSESDSSSESSSSESESEENEESDTAPFKEEPTVLTDQQLPALMGDAVIPVTDDDEGSFKNTRCRTIPGLRQLRVNVTSASFYVIVALNTNRLSNAIHLKVMLDRTRYTFHKSAQTFDMCSLSTSCTIGLSFASQDRAVVWIPADTSEDPFRSTYVIRSQCKPRLAVFAILSVFFPLVVFLAVAFVVRADRDRIMRMYRAQNQEATLGHPSDRRFAAPLLDDVTVEAGRPCINDPTDSEELPPAYDPPPPYSCLTKQETCK